MDTKPNNHNCNTCFKKKKACSVPNNQKLGGQENLISWNI